MVVQSKLCLGCTALVYSLQAHSKVSDAQRLVCQRVGKCQRKKGTQLTETAASLKGLPLANNLIININNENRDYNPLNKTERHEPTWVQINKH